MLMEFLTYRGIIQDWSFDDLAEFYCRLKIAIFFKGLFVLFVIVSDAPVQFLTSLPELKWLGFPLCTTATKNFKYYRIWQQK